MSKEFEWTITPHDCGRRQIFVKGYKKADGTEVKSYCREPPSRKLSGSYEGPMTKKEAREFEQREMLSGFE